MKTHYLIFAIATWAIAGCTGETSYTRSSITHSSSSVAAQISTSVAVSSSDVASVSSFSSAHVVSSAASSEAAATGDRFNLSAAEVAKSVICPGAPALTVNDREFGLPTGFEDQIRVALADGGLSGSVHGVARIDQKYVISLSPQNVNNPNTRFRGSRMSVFSQDPEVLEKFKDLRRDRAVRIQGELVPTASPQPHINVTALTFADEPFQYNREEYKHAFDDSIFAGRTTAKLLGTVHAIIGKGEAIVMNFEDMILPIMVDEKWQPIAAKLWRADRIQVDVSIQQVPGRPTHFYTRTAAQEAIKLVDKISNCHGNTITLEGDLMRLNSQNFLGVKSVDANGVPLVFLILPGAAGADAAKAAWGDFEFNPATDTEGRNHFYRNGIKVRVTGEARVLDPGVAHTQIWIEDAAGFEVISQN